MLSHALADTADDTDRALDGSISLTKLPLDALNDDIDPIVPVLAELGSAAVMLSCERRDAGTSTTVVIHSDQPGDS